MNLRSEVPNLKEPEVGTSEKARKEVKKWTETGEKWLARLRGKLDEKPREVINEIERVKDGQEEFVVGSEPEGGTDDKLSGKEVEQKRPEAILPESLKRHLEKVNDLITQACHGKAFSIIKAEKVATGGSHPWRIEAQIGNEVRAFYFKNGDTTHYPQEMIREIGTIFGINFPEIWGAGHQKSSFRTPEVDSSGVVRFKEGNGQCLKSSATLTAEIKGNDIKDAGTLNSSQAGALGRLTAFCHIFGIFDIKLDHIFVLPDGSVTKIDNGVLFDFYRVSGATTILDLDVQRTLATKLFEDSRFITEENRKYFLAEIEALYAELHFTQNQVSDVLERYLGQVEGLDTSTIELIINNIDKQAVKTAKQL